MSEQLATNGLTDTTPVSAFSVIKNFGPFLCAHRNRKHLGHCRFLHGYHRRVSVKFSAQVLDASGFVVDFGDLKWLRDWLIKTYDDKILIGVDDTKLYTLIMQAGLAVPEQISMVPDPTIEKSALHIYSFITAFIASNKEYRERGVVCKSVLVSENTRNAIEVCP